MLLITKKIKIQKKLYKKLNNEQFLFFYHILLLLTLIEQFLQKLKELRKIQES